MISLGQMLLCLFGVPYSKRNATPLRIMLKMFLKKNILYYSKLLKRFRIDSGELFGLLYVTTHDHPPVSNLSNASGDLVTTTTSTLLLYIYILLLYIYIYIYSVHKPTVKHELRRNPLRNTALKIVESTPVLTWLLFKSIQFDFPCRCYDVRFLFR